LELILQLHIDLVSRPSGHRDVTPGAVARASVGIVQTVSDLGEDPVLGIDHFTVEVDNLTLRPGEDAGILKLCPNIPNRGSLPGSGLSIEKNIRGGLVVEGRCQDGCQLVDLWFPVRKYVRAIAVTEHFPVLKY